MPARAQLERYADVLIHHGLNVQSGQPILLSAPLDTADFVRILVSRLYDAGAGIVDVDWYDPIARRIRLEKAPDAALRHVPRWQVQKSNEEVALNTGFLHIDAEDPDLLSGIDPSRVAMQQRARGTAFKEIDDLFMADRVTWVVCAVPTENWAIRVYPEAASPAEALEKLWHSILTTMRADTEDPIEAWRLHLADLERRAEALTRRRVRRLHYQGPGTDLTVDLPDGHVWLTAQSRNAQGASFCSNLPTEEIYTLPRLDGVNGTIRSTMPVSYGGVIIDGIELRFSAGRVVDARATSGEATLRELLDTDDGSRFLGEVALVSADSPVHRVGRLFYSTLFDENASCHLALGKAYPTCLQGGGAMSETELRSHGVNDSIVHVDFMVGSEELSVDGETSDGSLIPLLRRGLWTF